MWNTTCEEKHKMCKTVVGNLLIKLVAFWSNWVSFWWNWMTFWSNWVTFLIKLSEFLIKISDFWSNLVTFWSNLVSFWSNCMTCAVSRWCGEGRTHGGAPLPLTKINWVFFCLFVRLVVFCVFCYVGCFVLSLVATFV